MTYESIQSLRTWGMFLGTIIFFSVWYIWWYPYTNMLLHYHEQQIKITQKKMNTIRALENTCSTLACATTTLETDVMRCIETHKEQCNTDAIVSNILKQMLTHNLHIKQCSLHHIKNNTPFYTCSATFLLEGSISHFLEFLNDTRQHGYTIIPTDVSINNHNNNTTITYTCTWIRYT